MLAAVAMAAVSGAMAAKAASDRNAAAKRSAQSVAESARLQYIQNNLAYDAEQQKRIDQARSLKGRVSALAASSGMGGQSVEQTLAAVDSAAASDEAILRGNTGRDNLNVYSRASAQTTELASHTQSPFLAFAQGAISSFAGMGGGAMLAGAGGGGMPMNTPENVVTDLQLGPAEANPGLIYNP